MSALDDVVNIHQSYTYQQARAELAQLRHESQRRLEDLEMIEKKCLQLRSDLKAAQERSAQLEAAVIEVDKAMVNGDLIYIILRQLL